MNLNWKLLLRLGLIGGIVTLYVGVIGMLEAFTEREIIREVVTLAQIILFAPPVVVGFLAVRRNHDSQSVPVRLLSGGIVGLVSSIPSVVLVLIASQIDLQEILVNINRKLLGIFTFGQESLLTGAVILIVAFTTAGFIGAAVYLIPNRLRSALLIGLVSVLTIGALSELVRQILQQVVDRDTLRLIFNRGALTSNAAILIFLAAAGLNLLWKYQQSTVRTGVATLPEPQRRNLQRGGMVILVLILLALPWLVGTAASDVLTTVGLYVLMGLGLNIAIGLAGLLDLGYVTVFAVGAYVMGVLTSTGPLGADAKAGIEVFNFWLVLPISLLIAMFTGFMLAVPILRMRGDYLAIATLGFGEIIRLLAISDWLKPLIGGAQGVLFIPKPEIFGVILNDPQQIYYILLAASALAIFVSTRLNNSRTGRQWMAIREDEDVAAAMGINTAKAKLLAFTLSAATGGVAGAIFATKVGAIFPNSFNLFVSINVLCLIIVGGMGSIPGTVVGAIVLIGLPELLREFDEFRLLLYGILLIIMMLARPEGLWPSAVRRREIRGAEADQSATQVAEAPRDSSPAVAGD